MKSLVDLCATLLRDCERVGRAPVARDVATLLARSEHEGESFITITLPAFCKDFERCLAEGRVSPGLFRSFRKERSGIPSFLKGFLSQVFGSDGCLLAKPSIDCIRAVRQICLMCKKVERPCTSARVSAAIESYAKCDGEVVLPSGQLHRYFKIVSQILWGNILDGDFRPDLVPKHGPGATQERISGNQKWNFLTWHRRLSEVGFTYLLYGRGTTLGISTCPESGISTIDSDEPWPRLLEPGDEPPCRVVVVPKTQKAPRVIAVEPVCMQYAQQALSQWLVRRLESRLPTAGHLNFKDQSVNQAMATEASRWGNYATLDLSEASDRVSKEIVWDMLESVPMFRDWVFACRSRRASLPSGEVLTLNKFASMGSALCFPIESMVFFTIIIASRLIRAGNFPTWQTVSDAAQSVYVYGDDLLVPADEARSISDDLESQGLKVNQHKSFWTGKFRESCGVDSYDGVQVTPVYLRSDCPTNRADADAVLSVVACANQLYSAGYYHASMALREAIERVLGPLPQVPSHTNPLRRAGAKSEISPETAAIGWFDDSEVKPPTRWNHSLQRLERLCWVPVTTWCKDTLSGIPALAKCFRFIGTQVPMDPRHLERSVRPYSLTMKRRDRKSVV